MYAHQLRIDTSAGAGGSSTYRSPSSLSPNPGLRVHDLLSSRSRSASNASASSSSSLSLVTPASSSNASAVSLVLPSGQSSMLPRPSAAYSYSPYNSHHSSRAPSPQTTGDPSEYVLAMHDYIPQQGAATCLSFRAGQVIRVLNRDPSGWWDGELEGRRGWFPSNYVNTDLDDEEDADAEDLTQVPIGPKSGHSHTDSRSSVTSWASSTTREPDRDTPSQASTSRPHPDPDSEAEPDSDPAFPPIMDSLVHGLSLLQNAVRSRRISHFQPSTACIISCVRSVLTATEALNRDAPILVQHPILGTERGHILAVLASLVAQAKKASEEGLAEDKQEMEIANMMRLGGQVFAHVRRFLAVAVQCGVTLPERRGSYPAQSPSSDVAGPSRSSGSAKSPKASPTRLRKPTLTHSHTPTQNAKRVDRVSLSFDATPGRGAFLETPKGGKGKNVRPGTPGSGMKAKSLNDLRYAQRIATGPGVKQEGSVPALPGRVSQTSSSASSSKQQQTPGRTLRRHRTQTSEASTASTSSSLDSLDSDPNGPAPKHPFPRGPSTSTHVQEVLRQTHSQYLSTIAAFIGHAHSHSRFSHASSMGHLHDLMSAIGELACNLLTLVEAVLQHPEVGDTRKMNLRSAKESVYGATSALAGAVRMLSVGTTQPPLLSPMEMTDEQEKENLIRRATDALKAGSDCVAAAKMCLSRPMAEDRPMILYVADVTSTSEEPNEWLNRPLNKVTSAGALRALQAQGGRPEDGRPLQAPALARGQLPDSSSGEESGGSKSTTSALSEVTNITSPDERKAVPPPLVLSRATVEAPLTSPVSLARTDDDGTTWEGSMRSQAGALEDKMVSGYLPMPPNEFQGTFQDPMGWLSSHDYPSDDVAYNSDGHLVGATLGVLVERMTPHDSIVDPAFSAVFFLTFRLFATPMELVEALISRYNLLPPANLPEDMLQVWQQRKGIPVRLRVSNFIKMWVESFWRRELDDVALPSLTRFVRDGLGSMFAGPARRIMDLLEKRRQSSTDATISPKGDRTRDPGMQINPPGALTMPATEIPRPSMTKALLTALRARNFQSISITDFDALELARQLTIMECALYCAIQPDEVLSAGTEGRKAENVRALSTLSTVITGWVTESILDEQDTKKRAGLLKFFIKVADRCTSVNNFSSSRSMLAALDSSTIARLHQTWAVVPQKNKLQLEAMRKLADHSRNYHQYRSTLRNTAPPAVPFLGLYLTDVTFCREGNPSHRASPGNGEKKLLNFNKYHKLARIVQDMQRFQVPYNLKEIPEVQQYLSFVFDRSKRMTDLQDLYRRSLEIEPRQNADPTSTTSDSRQLFNWATRTAPSQPENASKNSLSSI